MTLRLPPEMYDYVISNVASKRTSNFFDRQIKPPFSHTNHMWHLQMRTAEHFSKAATYYVHVSGFKVQILSLQNVRQLHGRKKISSEITMIS
jgi:hypothetical protein